ncbi:MAG: hypothetical protein OXC72_05950 [Roseovarius sp.]|nr:hypothetical protein [Roseovarius sp.]
MSNAEFSLECAIKGLLEFDDQQASLISIGHLLEYINQHLMEAHKELSEVRDVTGFRNIQDERLI